jgi:CTP:molybdopterin cytidylyltransferase MocA
VEVQSLVLAAGQGERFGGNKLATHYRGRPLLAHVLDVVSAACKSGLVHGGHVIVAAEDQTSQDLCTRAGLEPIRNEAPGLGLSHSLQLGLGALEKMNDDPPAAAIIFLGDQPRVRLEIVEQLIAAYRRHPAAVIRPRYQQQPDVPGHPTLLDRSVWHLARGLEGDRGIGALLAGTSTEITMLDVPGDNPDVDTRADLLALDELAP